MNVKKKYNVGDTVWIYGISRDNVKSTQGTILKMFVIDYDGFNKEPHYVIGIPTEIEMLLEIRTWHTISQTKDGRVGGIRDAFENPDAAHKMLLRTGMSIISTDEEFEEHMAEEDDISPDDIHAAMERSQQSATVPPLNLKESRPKRRHYPRKQ